MFLLLPELTGDSPDLPPPSIFMEGQQQLMWREGAVFKDMIINQSPTRRAK